MKWKNTGGALCVLELQWRYVSDVTVDVGHIFEMLCPLRVCSSRCCGRFTVTLHVVVQKQAVVDGDEAEAGVVALFGNIAGGKTGIGQMSWSAAHTPGPLEGLDVPRQTHTFT